MKTAVDIVGGSRPRSKKSYCEERAKTDTDAQFSDVGKLSKLIKNAIYSKSHIDLSKTVQTVLNLAVIEGLWFGLFSVVYLFFINIR